MAGRVGAAALAGSLCLVVLAGCGDTREASPARPAGWSQPNANRSSTRAIAGPAAPTSPQTLRVRWRFRLRGEPGFSGIDAATPVVSGGRVYLQDLNSNVYALALADGRLLWRHHYGRPSGGPNGLAVADGVVYGNTDTSAFALSARTGAERWRTRLTRSRNPVTIAPVVANGLVYTSSTGQAPGGRGTLYALDARTGAVRWRFDTIVGPWRFPREASGGGAWHPPSVGADGHVYWGTANPYPWGGSRARPNGGMYPGPVRHTDSLLMLDGKTGELLWSDQVTPHDVRDYDFQLPPLLLGDAVVGAGKAGRVIAWDRSTGARRWEVEVGRHRNDRGPLPTRPVSVCPGLLGGVETPMAADGGRIFVPVVDLCFRESAYGSSALGFYSTDYSKGTGELVALDASDGRRLWAKRFSSPVFGCATVVGGVVYTSTYDGRVYGLSTRDGSVLAQARMRAGINACPSASGRTLLVGAGADHPDFPAPVFELVAYAIPGT
ncbi:MAG TPA: PQQ-binding-like beta-propeller repeat protein [Gaiella sp.]